MNLNFPGELAAHLAESVRSARHSYRKRLARCQKKFSQKAVHDLRIETRRILALLDLLEALHFAEPLKKLRKTFKKRLDAFDDMRDTHVQLNLLEPFWTDFPKARDFKRHLRKCEKRLASKLSRRISSTKSGQLNGQLKQIEKSLSKCPRTQAAARSVALARSVLAGAFNRVAELRRLIRRDQPATIHRMRVAFKRFRYTAELLQPFLPQFTIQRLARMKEFQATAGNVQDLAVLLARIDKDIKNGCVAAACVKNLRAELLRRERRAIDSCVVKLGELAEFEPERPAASSVSTRPRVQQVEHAKYA